MDIRKVKKLIELLESSGINEIEIKEGEEAVRISRGSPMQSYNVAVPQAAPPPPPAAASLASTGSDDTAESSAYKGQPVKSPMVGTFYRSPSPTSNSWGMKKGGAAVLERIASRRRMCLFFG